MQMSMNTNPGELGLLSQTYMGTKGLRGLVKISRAVQVDNNSLKEMR